MNSLSTKLCIVLLGAMVALTGCTKKPKRPAPSDTMLGQGGTQSGVGVGGMDNLGDSTAPGITQRVEGDNIIDNGQTIRNLLKPVYFELNQSAIKPDERAKLQAAKDYIDKNPQYRLLFEGHCDWRGTGEYNIALGDRRANAAKKYITTIGVPTAKIETVSKGDLEAKENGAEEEMAKDRRVEIVVLKQ